MKASERERGQEKERKGMREDRRRGRRKEGEGRERDVVSYLAWNSFVHRECDMFSMESQRQCV